MGSIVHGVAKRWTQLRLSLLLSNIQRNRKECYIQRKKKKEVSLRGTD